MASNDPKIQEKIKQLKNYWYDDDYSLKFIEAIETKIRNLITAEELGQNKAVMAIVDDAVKRISTINKLLIYKEDMTDEERKMLFHEKKVHQFYLDRFDSRNLGEKFEQVEKMLDEEIKKISS